MTRRRFAHLCCQLGLSAPLIGFATPINKPLFRDPVHDGAADPVVIYNRPKQEWWMFYTNRRADLAADDPKNVAWVHQTRLGIAISKDGGQTWKYKGIAEIPYGTPEYTHWAPDIVFEAGAYHMFLTIVPGTFTNWNAPREIIHLTSPDLEHWKFLSKLELSSDRVIDPALYKFPDGTWRLWYKDERDHSHIHYAESRDLNTWQPKGAAITDRNSEGPKVFRWQEKYWMIVDMWKGLAVYHSEDGLHWTPQAERLLDKPGKSPTDQGFGHHCDVVVSGDRAFLFYFTHQDGPDEEKSLPHSAQRTALQAAELLFEANRLTTDRDRSFQIKLQH